MFIISFQRENMVGKFENWLVSQMGTTPAMGPMTSYLICPLPQSPHLSMEGNQCWYEDITH